MYLYVNSDAGSLLLGRIKAMIRKIGRLIAYDVEECGGVMSAIVFANVLMVSLAALAVTFSNGGW